MDKTIFLKARRLQEDIDASSGMLPRKSTERQPPVDIFDQLVTDKALKKTVEKLYRDGHHARAVEEAYKFIDNLVKATPYNGVQIKRNILESGRSQGCPLKSLPGQTTIRLPDKVCQPGSGLPEQTSCSVLQSVFAALGSGSYKTRAAALPQQKHVPLWRVRRISRVLCV